MTSGSSRIARPAPNLARLHSRVVRNASASVSLRCNFYTLGGCYFTDTESAARGLMHLIHDQFQLVPTMKLCLVVAVPAGVVIVMSPAVAPAGTRVATEVAVSEMIGAGVPLKVTL